MSYDRLKAAIFDLIDRRLARFNYFASYPSRVAVMNDDGTVDLVPDDVRNDRGELVKMMPMVQRVPLRPGLPGVAIKVKKDSRVLLAFEAGDKGRPVATVWDASALEELKIVAGVKIVIDCPDVELGGEGGARVARTGDPVEVILPPTVVVTGFVGPPSPATALTGTITFSQRALGTVQASSKTTKSK